MARLLVRALKSATLFAYGLFTLFVYGLLQIKSGNFFKRSTEKENLELQLGTYNPPSLGTASLRRSRGNELADQNPTSARPVLESIIRMVRFFAPVPDAAQRLQIPLCLQRQARRGEEQAAGHLHPRIPGQLGYMAACHKLGGDPGRRDARCGGLAWLRRER
jgi:hypothetical protein